jgi:hypothetical protein
MKLQRHFGIEIAKATGRSVAMGLNRIRAKERGLAAIREAGHVIIARRVGLEVVSACIAPEAGGRTWIGQVQLKGVRWADEHALRMVGVAGSVAEHLWSGGGVEGYSPQGTMSESDWHLARCVQDEPNDLLMDAARDVARLLTRGGPGWQALIAEARRLIISSRERPSIDRYQPLAIRWRPGRHSIPSAQTTNALTN